MRKLRITELSAVDRPAQTHARVVLMKRADDDHEQDEMDISKIASFGTLDDAINAIAKREGCLRHVAMSKAANAFPALLDAYQREGEERITKAADATKPRPVNKAVLAFDDKVVEIAKSRGLSRHAAISAARERFPEEFEAAYGHR